MAHNMNPGDELLGMLYLKSEMRKAASEIILRAFPEAGLEECTFTQKPSGKNDDGDCVIFDECFTYKNVRLCLRATRTQDGGKFSVMHLTNADLETVEVDDLSNLRETVMGKFCNFAARLYEHVCLPDMKAEHEIDIKDWPVTVLSSRYRGCSLAATFEPDGKCHATITRGAEQVAIDETADIKRMDVLADLINKKIDEFGPVNEETTETSTEETPCDFCELGKEVKSYFDPYASAIYTMRYSKETGVVTVKNDDRKGMFKFPKCPFCGKPLGNAPA